MDAVTHAAMGCVLAAPLVPEHPGAAACVAIGSVLPDLDSSARVFGRRAFLRSHQTWTHSLPVIAVAALIAWPLLRGLGVTDPWAPLGLWGALTLHALIDATNTYGITLWAPCSRRRTSLEWVFFVDGVALAATVGALVLVGLRFGAGRRAGDVTAVYAIVMLAYWIARAWLRHRAARFAPAGTRSLVPSALVPWRFLGYARTADSIETFRLDARLGRIDERFAHDVLDDRHEDALAGVPEFRAMRELTPAYHVVEVRDAGRTLVCRDLRTRNFGGLFGTLEVTSSDGGVPRTVRFRV